MFSFLNPFPHLPEYAGPHKVGTTEFEIPISEIPSSSAIPDQKITTVKFRLFYPTTADARSSKPVYWLPEPQKQWNTAYASFMGADSGWSTLVAPRALSVWNNAQIPAVKDSPLLPAAAPATYPISIFSHGLGGNYNTYSSLVGSLASCGIVCIVPEHRDGSAPISFIKNAQGKIQASVPYQKLSHTPTTEVLNARNAQLRIRLWELELIYSVITAMNTGKTFTNYAAGADLSVEEKESSTMLQTMLTGRLNFDPGEVTWLGHSFGAATMAQLVKSVFYHQHLPESPINPTEDEKDVDWTPLYSCTSNSDLVRQITPDSPVVLLDIWTMALRGESTKWLWERPMPCYHRSTLETSSKAPSTVAIMSAEFYKWTDLLNRTRALLSKAPLEASIAFEQKKHEREQTSSIPDEVTNPTLTVPAISDQTFSSSAIRSLSPPTASSTPSRTPSPLSAASVSDSESTTSSTTSLTPSVHEYSPSSVTHPTLASCEPRIYLIPNSAHLSQSDFGVLFPNLTKYAMKAIEPEKTIQLNVRAILAVMRGRGIPVRSLAQDEQEDHILEDPDDNHTIDRWVKIPLLDQ